MYWRRMPTYDYSCSDCSHKFERFEPLGTGGLKECPSCGRKKARRLLGTGAGLIFKGAGFYTTDSKRPAPSPDKKAEPPKVEKKEEKKVEAKKEEARK